MTSLEQKQSTLKKILGSDEFKKKALYQKLLTYLVEASLNDLVPKEVTIAQDVFEKGDEFNASLDTSVRVYVHNLRNKLQHYYQSDGKDDPLQIRIPKGRVHIRRYGKLHLDVISANTLGKILQRIVHDIYVKRFSGCAILY